MLLSEKEKLIDCVFSEKGLLSRYLTEYEERLGQNAMASQVLQSYVEETIALIEAGTGIGKSLAYLVPAVYWALKHQQKTVISTHTISLQEQLIFKDIPFLLKAMDADLKAVLVKGMGNYLCLRKLHELQEQPLLFSSEESKEVQKIEKWAEKAEEGSRSEIPFSIQAGTWEKVACESDACSHVHCPYYKQCFFFQARRQAGDAQLLIVNHHLLLADLIGKTKQEVQEEKRIIPSFEHVILDEAHHLEQVALESFACSLDRIGLQRLLSRIHSENHPEQSRLSLIQKGLTDASSVLRHKLDILVPVQKKECATLVEQAFSEVAHFLEMVGCRSGRESKLRVTAAMMAHASWQTAVKATFQQLSGQLKGLAQTLLGIEKDLAPQQEKLANHLLDLHSTALRLEEQAEMIERYFKGDTEEGRVRWIEMNGANLVLVDAQLDISSLLKEHFFQEKRSVALCSATLSTNRSFEFLKERLGLDGETKVSEQIYESPFNYKERALLVVPTDLPLPSDPSFLQASMDAIERAIEISEGNAFVLFTSYDMLENVYEKFLREERCQKYPLLKQGQLSRHQLLEKFKKTEGSVLFATNSFWEGVDVPGEALRCVIIVKLPFQVPTEPLYQAYTEAIEKEGKNPFFDYAVPQAVIKFKQGFGRLMRAKNDRGCILCLDTRLAKKAYGKIFLNSLPACRTCFLPQKRAWEEMGHFYEQTKLV